MDLCCKSTEHNSFEKQLPCRHFIWFSRCFPSLAFVNYLPHQKDNDQFSMVLKYPHDLLSFTWPLLAKQTKNQSNMDSSSEIQNLIVKSFKCANFAKHENYLTDTPSMKKITIWNPNCIELNVFAGISKDSLFTFFTTSKSSDITWRGRKQELEI
jgi:hypothetical protein